MPKALKSCPKSNKSPNLVTLKAMQREREKNSRSVVQTKHPGIKLNVKGLLNEANEEVIELALSRRDENLYERYTIIKGAIGRLCRKRK